MTYQAAARAAAVELLRGCAEDAGVRLQVYRGRPASVRPPCAFVESIGTTIDPLTATVAQHRLSVTVTMVWGLFDSGEAVDQRDLLVDALHEWVRTRFHAMSGRSLFGPPATIDDLPAWVPDWLPRDAQQTYFATQATFTASGSD